MQKQKVVIVQKHCCKNDVNGNPRRLWVFYEVEVGGGEESPHAHISSIWDEGYVGWPPHGIGPRSDYAELPSVTIDIPTYKNLRQSKHYKG